MRRFTLILFALALPAAAPAATTAPPYFLFRAAPPGVLASFYVASPGPLTITVESAFAHGATIDVIDPDGIVIEHVNVPDVGYDHYVPWSGTITPATAGVHQLLITEVCPFYGCDENRYRLTISSRCLVMPGGNVVWDPGTWAYQGGDFWFYVPAGTNGFDFSVEAVHEYSFLGEVRVLAPDGTSRAYFRLADPPYGNGITSAHINVEPWNASAFWRVSVHNENDNIRFSVTGVPNWFASTKSAYFVPETGGPFVIAADDWNGDTKADLIWHNTATGQNGFWLMDGANAIGSAFTHGTGANWEIQASGDLDGDGNPDLILRDATANRTAVWFLTGTIPSGSAWLPDIETGFALAGCGDLNADGFEDLVWRNPTSGETRIWLMEGAAIVGMWPLGFINPEWSVAAVADLDGDSSPELILRNDATGQNAVWFLLRGGYYYSAFIDVGLPAEWTLAGAGDFDGDGLSDLVWRNDTTGQNAIWFMDGTHVRETRFIGSTDPSWRIIGPR